MVHQPLHQARRQGSLHLQVTTSNTAPLSRLHCAPRTMFGVDYCSPSEDKSYSGRMCVGSCKEDSHEDEVGRRNNCVYLVFSFTTTGGSLQVLRGPDAQ